MVQQSISLASSTRQKASCFDHTNTLKLAASNTLFNFSNLGSNQVTLTVTDPSGNTATCVANVTVAAAQWLESFRLFPNPNVGVFAKVVIQR